MTSKNLNGKSIAAQPEPAAVRGSKQRQVKKKRFDYVASDDSEAALADFAVKINAAYKKALEGIIETGRLLTQAKKDFPRQFGSLFVDLPFSQRTGERFMKIAENEVLSDPTHVSNLPACWSVLHTLTSIPDHRLKKLIERRVIHRDLERSDAERLVKDASLEGLPRALGVLIDAMDEYPDAEQLVGDLKQALEEEQCEVFNTIGSLSAWITKLSAAWEQAEKKELAECDEWDARDAAVDAKAKAEAEADAAPFEPKPKHKSKNGETASMT